MKQTGNNPVSPGPYFQAGPGSSVHFAICAGAVLRPRVFSRACQAGKPHSPEPRAPRGLEILRALIPGWDPGRRQPPQSTQGGPATARQAPKAAAGAGKDTRQGVAGRCQGSPAKEHGNHRDDPGADWVAGGPLRRSPYFRRTAAAPPPPRRSPYFRRTAAGKPREFSFWGGRRAGCDGSTNQDPMSP